MSANGASYHDHALRDICDTKGIDVRKELLSWSQPIMKVKLKKTT